MRWRVIEMRPHDGRVVLQSTTSERVIAVKPEKIVGGMPTADGDTPPGADGGMALAIPWATPPAASLAGADGGMELAIPEVGTSSSYSGDSLDQNMNILVRDVIRAATTNNFVLGKWLALPLNGKGEIKLQRCAEGAAPLVYYDALRERGLTLVFRNSAFPGETIIFEHCDILKVCPQDFWWVYCLQCKRFLFPARAHRASREHERRSRLGWSIPSMQQWSLTDH
jgi:hypothetical protein